MDNNSTLDKMADALSTEKDKNGYKGKLYKAKQGVYKEESDKHKGRQLADTIRSGSKTLRESLALPKIDMCNTEAVKERLFQYFDACELSQTFPSVMGMSAVFGLSRQAVNQWLLRNQGHPTSDLIARAKDVMADILTNSGLYGSANPVAMIFTLKNHFEHADRIELTPVTNTLTENDYDADAIRRRYLMPGEDD